MIDLDPRTRLILVALVSTSAIAIKDIKGLSALLVFTLACTQILSISIYQSIKRIKRFWYAFFAIALIQSVFSKGGDALISLGSIDILTTKGLIIGISIILRLSIIIISASIIASAGIMNIVYGLLAMKLPYEIAFMVLIAIKFLPLFQEEFMDSMIAIQLSGVDVKKIPISRKLSLYSYILTPSVVNSIKRAKFMSAAMECRGFRVYPNRTSYCRLKMNLIDYFIIFITLTLLVLIYVFA